MIKEEKIMSRPILLSALALTLVVLWGAFCANSASATLIHYWSMDDATGNGSLTLADTANQYQQGAGAPTPVPLTPKNLDAGGAGAYGVITGHDGVATNKAVQIKEGSNNSGSFDALGLYTIPKNFTFEAWIRWDNGSANQPQFGMLTNRFGPLALTPGGNGVHLNSWGSAYQDYTVATNTVNSYGSVSTANGAWVHSGFSEWYFIQITGNATTHLMDVWITPSGAASGLIGTSTTAHPGDGEHFQAAYNPPASPTNAVNVFSLGVDDTYLGSQSKYTFQGYYDMAAIWDTPLSPTTLQSQYTNGLQLEAPTTIPEPSNIVMLTLGGLSLLAWRTCRPRARRITSA